MCKKVSLLILVLGMSLTLPSANAGQISYVKITGDADCGISTDNTYTHTIDFGTGTPGALINGVQFDAYNAAANGTLNFNRASDSGGASEHAGNAGHNVSGGLVALLTDMYYNGDNAPGGTTTWTLSGLKPGKTYHTRIYTRQWGAGGTRFVTFVFDPDGDGPIADSTVNINEDDATTVGMANANDAYYINYQFKAVAGQDLVITGTQEILNYSWHLYGLTNQEFSAETASPLLPEDGAADVLRDGDLTWEPGDYPGTHNVYVGTSYDDVDAATVPTASGLDVASFDPGRLEFGATYFWRVDEVNGTPDKTVFKGDVWSFTVEPYAIVIPVDVSNVTASSSAVVNPPSLTVDGSGLTASAHGTDSATMWLSAAVDMTPWLMYEFDTVQKLDTLLIWNSNTTSEGFIGWGLKDVNIEVSLDGTDWTSLAESTQIAKAPGLATYSEPQAVDLGLALAKYVRINILSNWGGLLPQYGVAEVQFYGLPVYARTPDPVSGSTNVDPTGDVLTWRAGRETAQHDVSISEDPDTMGSAQTVTDNSLALSSMDLALGTTYYWQVAEVNDAMVPGTWVSDVWNFSTMGVLVVDDFEAYSNVSPDRPFQTWIDGVGFSNPAPGNPGNGSGAAIGHDIWSPSSPFFDGPIMETVIRYGGSQSMPVYYNGAGSQVDLSLDNENWTKHGLQTLSIAFQGAAGNTGQLYAKINNTKILYDQDPADIANASWLVWHIDLSTVTALENVTKLSIGVDGAGAAGMFYLDEIELSAKTAELITPVMPGTANLVAYYPFDGDLQDAAGSHHSTINSGQPSFVPGVQGQALELIGNQDVIVAYADDLALNSFTLSAWVNVSDIGGNRGILGTRFGSDVAFDLKVDANRIHGDVGNGTHTAWLNTAADMPTRINEGDWYHIGYVVDEANSAVRIYLNGALGTTIPISGTPLFMKAGEELHIGSSYPDVEYMYGTLDEVAIYNGALSPEEIAGLAGRTTPIYKPF
ncbi:MAG: discoidin domain-containing protein [Phycisphaerae bacterium]|nr:discoidin domain-containing protein [Phycisphaerae bacterium]